MNIYFAGYHFTNQALSGSNMYHYHLAKLLRDRGHSVKALSNQIKETIDVDGFEVVPLTKHREVEQWADLIFTFPMAHKACNAAIPTILIKHNDGKEVYDFSNYKIMYCGNAVKEKLQIPCRKDMVWHPFNRFAGTDKRGRRDGKWIMVNCNANKGGQRLIELAKMCPSIQFAGILGDYGHQITEPLPNLEYWPGDADMSKYYQQAAGLLSLSIREGFPTVVMEAMSHGLPVIGLPCAGFEDAIGNAGAVRRNLHQVKEVLMLYKHNIQAYNDACDSSLDRAAEIEKSRDVSKLLTFINS